MGGGGSQHVSQLAFGFGACGSSGKIKTKGRRRQGFELSESPLNRACSGEKSGDVASAGGYPMNGNPVVCAVMERLRGYLRIPVENERVDFVRREMKVVRILDLDG